VSLFRGRAKLGRSTRPGLQAFSKSEDGAVLALVAVFLPVAVLTVGMVLDLGMVYFAKRAVQGACDLGALAGVIELDWEALAAGEVRIDPAMGEAKAVQVTNENIGALGNVVRDFSISARVFNTPDREEPTVRVECCFKVRAHFLGFLPGLGQGIPCFVSSEGSVVRRTKW
jgi:Flp pilus assembly protein TadG